ncbi:MAG: cupin domain-containing protein [Bryobacteraceae bacterium]
MATTAHLEELSSQAAQYVLGELSGDAAKQFERRLASGCPYCLAETRAHTQALTAVAMSAPAAPPSGLKSKLMVRTGPAEAKSQLTLVTPEDSPWQPGPMAGVEFRFLRGKQTFLVRMAPGTSIPTHYHDHAEQCLVIEGSVYQEGVHAKAGDFVHMPAGTTHAPIRTDEGCVFLISYA